MPGLDVALDSVCSEEESRCSWQLRFAWHGDAHLGLCPAHDGEAEN